MNQRRGARPEVKSHPGNGNCDEPTGFVSPVRKRAFGDALISVGTLVVLLAILASFDPRVREQLSWRMNPSRAPEQVAQAGSTARALLAVVFDAMRAQSIDHAPLVIFVLAGVVLLLVMQRT